MPDAIITSTASTFGTISGTFAADQSTITGTVTGVVVGTLSGSVGVPGPQGPTGATGATGATGPAGSPGSPGVGVPVGGTAGQFLTKIDGTNYNTDWTTVNLSVYAVKSNNLSDLPSAPTARTNLGLGSLAVVNDAPSDGSQYARKNGAWDVVSASAFITSVSSPLAVATGNLTVDLSAYLTSATAASTYQTLAGMSSYLTSATAASTYYLQTNPSGFQTAADVTTALSPYLLSATAASTYAVIAAGQPVAGSTGQVLTKNSGTNYDSSWATLIPGDRYLTTSTTSNTIGNGNKTFTIGTGLSYTPTQDITISYDASNHMHGEVLTYNSGTGVLTVDVKNHTGSGTYAAWVVNVGGVTPATSVAWGAITGTLSTQTDLQSALDLKANLASPTFTGTPLSTTAAVDTNTTQIATTAYVVGNGYLKTATAASTYYLQTNPAGYQTAADVTTALSPYLLSATAASTYFTIASAANKADLASPTFTGTPSLPTGTTAVTQTLGTNNTTLATTAFVLANAPAAPVTSVAGRTGAIVLANTDISGLGTMSTATASDYSTTTVANGLYYPLSSNPAGYLTSAPVTSVAGRTGAITLSNTDISGLGTLATVNDAPSDGNQYARKNGAWDIVSVPSSYITSVSSPLSVTSGNLSVDLSAYLTSATAASTYQTISGMSSYLTTSTAASTYQTISGMSSYLTTSAAASTYLTQSNAASTYQTISGMSSYLTTSSAASTYQTQAGMSDYLSKAGNLAGLASTATARTNLGLGTMATATAADYSTTTVANGLYYPLSSNPAGYLTTAPVTSVAGRTGAVTLAVADVSGAAPLASPALTGTPTAPTATAGTNTTQLATTAFVTAAIPTNSVKAWVCFNGTGTVSIKASDNVTSITDNGVGNYTVNFTNALADANYAMVGSGTAATDSTNIDVGFFAATTSYTPSTKTTSAARIIVTRGANTVTDVADVGVAFFR